MKEHVFTLNSFNMPKVFEGSDAGYVLIIRLLLLDPGKYQSHPNMGVGLRTRYRYNMGDDTVIQLQQDIKNQIGKYLPELLTTEITLIEDQKLHTLGIVIDTDDGSYVMSYDPESQEIDTAASYVLENL